VGSVQRLATVVIVSLVALSTVLFLYLGDEDNRIDAEEEEQQEVAIERARENFIALCMQCHGPAGEGYTEPGAAGTGRIGAPLGGVNTSLNQQGINAAGTPVSGGLEGRADYIRERVTNGLTNPDGTVRMPAFSDKKGGPLNDEQINELVTMIQHVDWNSVYNQAVEESGGYPTFPPAPGGTSGPAATPAPSAATPAGEAEEEFTITSHDIFFDPKEVTIPADTNVRIVLPNDGGAAHNFSISELGISVDIAPGATGEAVINAPAGEYQYFCNVPGHKDAGMVGTLIVK
jgi:plastocyanin/mono/diheme cytochrome c family protein